MAELLYKTNPFQTPITQEYLDTFPDEVVADFWDYVNNVPFIKTLISEDRKYAKDLERDEDGKIIVDLVNPHILTDMDYFRESAIHFQKHGVYTKLKLNTHPLSQYMQWYKREVWRCWYGMVRESDGEWIPGELYFYLNYFPIIQTKIVTKGKARYGKRIIDFPEVWEGIYWRYHYWEQAKKGGMYNDFMGNQHAVEIAKRGASKSYSVGSRVLRDFVLGIDLETVEKVKSLVVAYNKEYLMKDGTLNKVMDGMDHLHKTTQFPSAKSKNAPSDMHWVSGWTDTDGFSRGSQNEIFGISISDDPDKIRGKRSNLVVYEEYAAFSKFLDTWQVALPNVQEGSLAFGQNIGIATGGSEGSDFAGALEMIMYPRGYNIYALPNVHDKGASGKRESLFFFPGYVNVKGFYNNNGVSDVVAAMFDELVFRHTLKYNSSDPVQLARRKSETAFTIQDAIMKTDSTIYPVADINDRINKIDNTPEITSSMYIGRLEIKDKQVVWVPDPDAKPIMNFPHKDNSLKGCVYIKEHPIKDSTGNVPWGRYISGADTIDTDGAQTLSLFSCYILDLWTDEIVAEYTGREAMVEDSFEIYRRLLIYYQAEGNYENNKKGLFSHFNKYNSLVHLSGQLDYLRDVENVRITFGNASKGTPSSKPIKQYGRIFIRDYLLSPVQTIVENVNEHGETYEETITIPRVHTICFRALLQELSMHNLDGNFDRHDALVMLMLLREDKLRLLGDSTFERRHADAEKDYLGDSEFFEANYGTTNYNEDQLERLKQLGLMEA